jgi:uncharacterized protein (TIGR02453 family)
VKQLVQYLEDLDANNTREWFNANKQRHLDTRDTFIAFTDALIQHLAAVDPAIAGVTVKQCLFRVHRDTRFSPDKRPYKTHAAAFIAPGGRLAPRAGYYFHVEPRGSLLAGGIWRPGAPLLAALRRDIYNNAAEFEEILANPAIARHYTLDTSHALKRVPPPYPASDPAATWTRHKTYILSCPLPEEDLLAPDAVTRVASLLQPLYPFNRFLDYTAAALIDTTGDNPLVIAPAR